MEPGRILCSECGAVADQRASAWRAYRGDVPGEDLEPTLVFFCPRCAEREFGPLGREKIAADLGD
jgi:hypothetical protein